MHWQRGVGRPTDVRDNSRRNCDRVEVKSLQVQEPHTWQTTNDLRSLFDSKQRGKMLYDAIKPSLINPDKYGALKSERG